MWHLLTIQQGAALVAGDDALRGVEGDVVADHEAALGLDPGRDAGDALGAVREQHTDLGPCDLRDAGGGAPVERSIARWRGSGAAAGCSFSGFSVGFPIKIDPSNLTFS